jgi:hypothetical protein
MRKFIANWLLQIANCKLNGSTHSKPVDQIPHCQRSSRTNRTVISVLCGITLFSIACTTSLADTVSSNVQKGIEAYQNRDFSTAIKSFEDAENAAPDDLRPVFDRGCVLAAQSEFEKASEQFKKSADAKDPKLAALSHYNLGCLAIQEANKLLGNKPEDAEDDARTKISRKIDSAIGHFRDALKANPRDENARHNLETLAAWRTYMQKTWSLRDRQKRREKMNLIEHLQMIETDQRALQAKVKALNHVAQDSPKKRQSVREAVAAQRDLLSEIGPLKKKIDQAAAGESKEAAVNAQEAAAMLKNGADEIGRSMQGSADRLAENRLAESLEPQTAAIENLDHLFAAVAPYASLVQKGITRQEEAIASSSLSKGEGPESKPDASKNAQGVADCSDAAWNQRFVERYGKIIPLKARQELAKLESQSGEQPSALKPPEKDEPKPDESAAESKNAEDEKTEEMLKAEEQKRSLKETLQLSLELAPKVEQLAGESADLLSQEKSADALPKQQECLKLLKEMLPKEQQKKEEEKKEEEKKCKECEKKKKNNEKKKCEQCEKKDKDKQGNKESDKNKKDQDKKGKDQKDQNPKEQDKDKKEQGKDKDKKGQGKKEQEKQAQAKPNEKSNEKAPKSSQQKNTQQPGEGGTASPREMSQKQAEALMKQAQERHKFYLEYQNEVQRALSRPENVDKDW